MPDITRGSAHVIFAFEVAQSIDLQKAEQRVAATERQTVRQPERAPSYFEYRPAPLRVTWEASEAIPVGAGAAARTVNLVMYDFGAISIAFTVPLSGSLSGLLPLAEALRGNQQLLREARRLADQLVARVRDAAVRPSVAPFVEDYVIFEVSALATPISAEALYRDCAPLLAQVLRAERRTLSTQEVAQATALRASYGPDDLTLVDADAAVVFDPQAADIRAVIEFANAQLLEMRFLDQQLDDALERSYQLLSRQRWYRRALSVYDPDIRQVARLQVDAAILFEQVTNALKLIGEQYLTRIYDMASRRFHLSEWDASIARKLEALESIYGKMADRAATRRMELLEWIIIILIAFSIIISLPGVKGP